MDMSRAMEAVSQYTADQWGLVTAAQAKAADVGAMTLSRLVEAGLLDRVRHGCYLVTSAPALAHVRERAVWLLLNPAVPAWERPRLDPDGGVLSHSSASVLHRVGDLLGETVEITVPRRRSTRQSDVRTRVAVLAEDEVTLVDGLPVTTVERTIFDLLEDHLDGSHIGQIIYDAIVAGKVDAERLVDGMGGFARRYGIARKDGRALLVDLLAQAGHTPEDLNRPRLPQRALSHPLSARDLLGPDMLIGLRQALQTSVAPGTLDFTAMLDAIRSRTGEELRAMLAGIPSADLSALRLMAAGLPALPDTRSLLLGAIGAASQPPGRLELPELNLGIGPVPPAGGGFRADSVAEGDEVDDNAVS